MMSAVRFSDVTSTHTAGSEPEDGERDQRAGQREARTSLPTRRLGHRSVLRVAAQQPELQHEKTRMTTNSTHAIAEAEPNWKKF